MDAATRRLRQGNLGATPGEASRGVLWASDHRPRDGRDGGAERERVGSLRVPNGAIETGEGALRREEFVS